MSIKQSYVSSDMSMKQSYVYIHIFWIINSKCIVKVLKEALYVMSTCYSYYYYLFCCCLFIYYYNTYYLFEHYNCCSISVLLPAPILYGKQFDSFCLLWKNPCQQSGFCSLYNLKGTRVHLNHYILTRFLHYVYSSVHICIIDAWNTSFVNMKR